VVVATTCGMMVLLFAVDVKFEELAAVCMLQVCDGKLTLVCSASLGLYVEDAISSIWRLGFVSTYQARISE
jgi:hypothetical protein